MLTPSSQSKEPIPINTKEIPSIDINTILAEGKKYLRPLPKRNFSVGKDQFVYTVTKGNRKPRRIGKAWGPDDIENSLERELVLRLAGTKDPHTAEDQIIKDFRQLLLRCAGDKNIREHLKKCFEKYRHIMNGNKAEDITPEMESQASQFYQELLELNFSKEDLNLIQEFSWDWKSTFKHCPNYCKCWVFVICIIQMIDLNKK